jgi:phosphatidylinositol glycan class B
MIKAFREALRNDPVLKRIFWGGFLVQIIFSITSVGYHFPDQHFQIIEFSSAQSGEPSGAPFVWEWENHVRPTIQIYLFTAFHKVLTLFGIHSPFTETLILRIIVGISMFLLFNLFTFVFLKDENKKIINIALIILNFSWFLPYLRTQYSAEMVSSFLFFGTVMWYYWKKDAKPGIGFLILIGILFGFTFYVRMQTLVLLAGFAIWLIWVQKAKKHILPILLGFTIGCAANLLLDVLFYNEFVFTPYKYFYTNIIEEGSQYGNTRVLVFYRHPGSTYCSSFSQSYFIVLCYQSIQEKLFSPYISQCRTFFYCSLFCRT